MAQDGLLTLVRPLCRPIGIVYTHFHLKSFCVWLHPQVVHAVLSGQQLERPSRCPRELYDLMQQCWAAEPEERPSFEEVSNCFK